MKEIAAFTVNEHGNLVISKVVEYEGAYQEIDAMDISDDDKFADLIEYQSCNGWGYANDCSQYGHLSEAPIIWNGDNFRYTEDTSASIEEQEGYPMAFWYDDMYMIRSAWEAFMRDGQVTFYFFDTEE